MKVRNLSMAGIALTFAALLLSDCAPSEREVPEGTVLGNVKVGLPPGTPAQPKELRLLSGVFDETGIAKDGTARLGLVPNAVSAVTAVSKDDEPLLYDIAIAPSEGYEVQLGARSTAEALVFLNPSLVQTDTGFAADVMSVIKTAPQLDTLTALIENRLSQSTGYLLADDSAMGVAVLGAVAAVRATIEGSMGSVRVEPAGHNMDGLPGADGGAEMPSGAEGLEFYLPAGENPFCGVGIRAERIGTGQYKLWITNDRRRYVSAFLRRGYSDDFIDSTLVFSSSAISVIPPHWTKPESSSILLDATTYPETWLLTYGSGYLGHDEWEADPHKERITLPTAATVCFDCIAPVLGVVTGVCGIMPKGSAKTTTLLSLACTSIGFKLVDKVSRHDLVGIVKDVALFMLGRLKDHPEDLVDLAAEAGTTITKTQAANILGKVPYVSFFFQSVDAFNLGWSIGTWRATYKNVYFGITYTGGGGGFPDSVVATVQVGDYPHGAAALPDGSRVYVNNFNSNSVSVIRTADNSVVKTISVGNNPHGGAALPSGDYVYVANDGSNSVSVIRTADDSVVKTISVGYNPRSVAALPNGSRVYVTNYGSNSVSVIRTADDSVVKTISVGAGCYGVAAQPGGSYVYVTNYDGNSISVIRTADDSVVKSISVGYSPHSVAAVPSGDYVYVANEGSNNVSVIRTADDSIVKTISVGNNPWSVAVLPSGEYVYVTNSHNTTVSVIRTADNTVVDVIQVGADPAGLAILPDGNSVYVANSNSNSVSVVGY